ncbi:hypothetical protein SAMN05428949_2211 [Chitinophaga sp. YR627]|nr:hypothetical protein SAMN05428949_2211 [Chitinophaga sp. YR627]
MLCDAENNRHDHLLRGGAGKHGGWFPGTGYLDSLINGITRRGKSHVEQFNYHNDIV